MYEFKTLERDIKINGVKVTAQIKISYDWDPDLIDGSFDFGNEAENQAYLKRFEDGGDLASIQILVIATLHGITGLDSLGECHIAQNNMESEINSILTEHCMVENALQDLKTNVLSQATKLNKYIK